MKNYPTITDYYVIGDDVFYNLNIKIIIKCILSGEKIIFKI
jgi:hypothetical protein